jgi:hypothetical protein
MIVGGGWRGISESEREEVAFTGVFLFDFWAF